MEKIDSILPDWIVDQLSLGQNLLVDGDRSDLNQTYWRMLSMCCPLIFEKYAIVLHSFAINQKIKELFKAGQEVFEDPLSNPDTHTISWADFFKLYHQEFNFENSYYIQNIIRKEIVKDSWPPYIWYPAEGNLDKEEFSEIFLKIKNLYNDQVVNYFYSLLKTKSWGNDILYKGLLSEFHKLKEEDEIKDNPTAVFPNTKEWCIISDYDLPFTFIGGSGKLIDSITNDTEYEIFQIGPKYAVNKK